jgi:ribosomal protein L29
MNTDITEQYLNKVYEDLSKEQMKLMTDMKSGGNELQKERDITKQITLINTLTLGVMKLRNLRKQIAEKINL